MLTSDGVKQLRSESPHNFYVQTLLRGGALGLLAFVALHGLLLSGLLRCAKRDVASRSFLLCMAVLVASQLVYYLGYGSDYIQAIFLGSAIGWLRHSETGHANR
jgi:O-antigen ligase